jgi:hypothetical protein
VAHLGYVGAACCGSKAKTLCFDSSNMCKVDTDFKGTVDLGALGLGSPGSTCASTANHLINKLGQSSWKSVTCDSMKSTVSHEHDGQSTSVLAHLGLVGAACCGSKAKTLCFDSSNMCKVDADFKGTVDLGALGLSSPGSTCATMADHLLLIKLGQSSLKNVTCDSMASTVSYEREGRNTSVLENLRSLGAACCGSIVKTRCFDTMCKVDSDFKENAKVGVSVPGEGNSTIDLTCGGGYGVTTQQISVWRQATGRIAMKWSDASCADMTKNLTAQFHTAYGHHLYLKSTTKEFVQTYGAACCGSLAKARDPCEVRLSATPAITF